jgi:hypothetical protein
MKKLLLLTLLVNSCFALAQDHTQHRVELTQKQKELCDRILGLNNQEPEIDTFKNELLLAEGCGINRSSLANSSFNEKRYPHCAQVLDFLEQYSNRLAQFDEKAKELQVSIEINNIKFDNLVEFYSSIFSQTDQNGSVEKKILYKQSPDSFNDEAMDHYKKLSQDLKENGIK